MSTFRTTLRALRHRNFRLFTAGQAFALIGYWMQGIAQGWLLYRLTGSATLLGLLGFAGSLPILLLAPLAGLWSDRANLHRLMFTIQVLQMFQAVALAALAIAGVIEPWHIIVLAMILGALVAFELPVRHAYLLELVGTKEDLANAVALTSMMANLGRLIGPALAGVTIGWIGEAGCFGLNALSFVIVLITFLMIRVTPTARPATHPPLWRGLTDGLAYAWRSLPIRLLLSLLALVALLATPYMALMPVITKDIFAGESEEMGFLVGSTGVGALAGTAYLASRRYVPGLVRVIVGASFAAGTALTLLAWSGTFWIALPLLAVIGFGILVTSVSTNMILQTIVDDDKRGRVLSLYTAAFLGMAPIGSMAAGLLADAIGISLTLTLGGASCAAAALYLNRQRPRIRGELRPIYERLGVIPK
jgi:MFS family permease